MPHAPGFLALVNDAKSRVPECTVDEVQARRAAGESFVLLDVREESEWQGGHIVGAEYLGKGVLERDVEGRYPDRDTPLVLYCGGGFRSALAADALQRMGYTRVLSMDGGYKAWAQSGYPVER